MKTCVFAGTFDPFTLGHKSMVDECLNRFGKVIIVIGENPLKRSVMPTADRKLAIDACYKNDGRVLTVCYKEIKQNFSEFLISQGATVYVRGIRNDADLEFEKAMEQKNKKLYPFITTEYIYAEQSVKEVSSTAVRELILKGESINKLVPSECLDIVLQSFRANL